MSIPRTEVESSQLAAVGHDAETNTLRVKFKSGSTYDYANVSAQKFEAFLSAGSLGRFFGAEVKAKADDHPFTKIESVKTEENEAPNA